MLGNELEKQFGIQQQYRSRYDKMFSEFISVSDVKPRDYNQNDVNAYAIITDSLKKGLRRLDIIKLLDLAVEKGYCVRNAGEPLPREEKPETQEKKVHSARAITRRREDETEKKSVFLQLAEEVGALREQVRMLSENLADLEIANGKVKVEKNVIISVERLGNYHTDRDSSVVYVPKKNSKKVKK